MNSKTHPCVRTRPRFTKRKPLTRGLSAGSWILSFPASATPPSRSSVTFSVCLHFPELPRRWTMSKSGGMWYRLLNVCGRDRREEETAANCSHIAPEGTAKPEDNELRQELCQNTVGRRNFSSKANEKNWGEEEKRNKRIFSRGFSHKFAETYAEKNANYIRGHFFACARENLLRRN